MDSLTISKLSAIAGGLVVNKDVWTFKIIAGDPEKVTGNRLALTKNLIKYQRIFK